MRKKLRYVLLLTVLIATGCTKESLEDCVSGVRLHFSFTLHEEASRGNLFGENLGSIQVYVFDNNGVLEQVRTEQGAALTNDYVMSLTLNPGKYTIIAWGSDNHNLLNTHSIYQTVALSSAATASGKEPVIGKSRIEDLRVELDCQPLSGTPQAVTPGRNDFDDLYYGAVGERGRDGRNLYTVIPVEVKEAEVYDRDVELIRNTNIVRVTIENANLLNGGNPVTNPADIMDIWMTGANTTYYFDDAVVRGMPQIRYNPQYSLPEVNKIRADVKIERLEWERPTQEQMKLYVRLKTGRVFYAGDLLELLKQAKNGRGGSVYNNQEDLDRIYLHPVKFVVGSDGSDLYIQVYVHGWEVIILNPGTT